FTYTIADGGGQSAAATVYVAVGPINDPPVAADDHFVTDEDTSITASFADLLANDSDPDGDALSLVPVAPPSHGTLQSNPGGTVTYTPNANFHGVDTLRYRLS